MSLPRTRGTIHASHDALELADIVQSSPGFMQRTRRFSKHLLAWGGYALGMVAGTAWAAEEPTVPFTPPAVHASAVAGKSLEETVSVVPAAKSRGLNGNEWLTQVYAYNATSEPQLLQIAGIKNCVTDGCDTTPMNPSGVSWVIPAGRSLNIEDGAAAMGYSRFSGAFQLTTNEGVSLQTRTDSITDAGRVGLGVVPQPVGKFSVNPDDYDAVAIVPNDIVNFYANLWLFSPEENVINYTIWSMDGSQIATLSRSLRAGQSLQLNDFLSKYYTDAEGTIVVDSPGDQPIAVTLDGDAPFNVGISAIDRRGLNDAFLLEPFTASKRFVRAFIGSTTGANYSNWVPSLRGWRPGDQPFDTLKITYYPNDGGEYSATQTVDLHNGFAIDDVIAHLRAANPAMPDGNTKGELWGSLCDGAYAVVEVSNINRDGSRSGQGSIPLERQEQVDNAVLFGFGGHDTRVNITLYEATGEREETFGKVIGFDGNTGERLLEFIYNLEPNGVLQKTDVLKNHRDYDNAFFRIISFGGVHAEANKINMELDLPPEDRHNDPSYHAAIQTSEEFGLEMIVVTDKNVNPFETQHVRIFGRIGYTADPRFTQLEIDVNGDGDLADAADVVMPLDHRNNFLYDLPIDLIHDGSASGQDIWIRYTLKGKHRVLDTPGTSHLEDISRTVYKKVEVGLISEMGIDWRTREDASQAVNDRIISQWDWYIDNLTQGANASSRENVEAFLGATTACDDIVYDLVDTSNGFGARGCGNQGVLGTMYEVPFDEILEDLAQWVESPQTKVLTDYQTTTTDSVPR